MTNLDKQYEFLSLILYPFVHNVMKCTTAKETEWRENKK